MNAELGTSSKFPRLQRLRHSLDAHIQQSVWTVSAASAPSFFERPEKRR